MKLSTIIKQKRQELKRVSPRQRDRARQRAEGISGSAIAPQGDCRMKHDKGLSLTKALDLLLHRVGTRMMVMHSSDGDHFYIVPGGRVDKVAAEKILKRPDIMEFDDGLFPGNPQSWRLQH